MANARVHAIHLPRCWNAAFKQLHRCANTPLPLESKWALPAPQSQNIPSLTVPSSVSFASPLHCNFISWSGPTWQYLAHTSHIPVPSACPLHEHVNQRCCVYRFPVAMYVHSLRCTQERIALLANGRSRVAGAARSAQHSGLVQVPPVSESATHVGNCGPQHSCSCMCAGGRAMASGESFRHTKTEVLGPQSSRPDSYSEFGLKSAPTSAPMSAGAPERTLESDPEAALTFLAGPARAGGRVACAVTQRKPGSSSV